MASPNTGLNKLKYKKVSQTVLSFFIKKVEIHIRKDTCF
jgi:hypothetical protein